MSTLRKLDHWMKVFAPSAEGEDGFLCAHIPVALVQEALDTIKAQQKQIEALEAAVDAVERDAQSLQDQLNSATEALQGEDA